MTGDRLLDTNIVVALLNEEIDLRTHVTERDKIFVSCIAIGELYFGAYKSS